MEAPTFDTPANFINFGPNGVCHYRTYLPARELKASMFVRSEKDLSIIKQIGPQDTPIVVYSMPRSDGMRDEVRQLKEFGVKVIADLDDYLPAFVDKPDHPGTYSPELVQAHIECVASCDLVTTTTPWLLERIKQTMNPNVVLCPNTLDIERWDRQRQPRHKEYTIIGWSGSIGHTNAIKRVAPVLNRVLRARPKTAICTAGMPIAEFIDEDLRSRCHDTLFHPIGSHPHVLTQFHINIGPTNEDEFYLAKSPLRALEAWASDSAFIGGSHTYGHLVNDGVDGLIADTEDEWEQALLSVIDDDVLRMRLRRNGRNRVREHHTIQNAGAEAWRSAIASLL